MLHKCFGWLKIHWDFSASPFFTGIDWSIYFSAAVSPKWWLEVGTCINHSMYTTLQLVIIHWSKSLAQWWICHMPMNSKEDRIFETKVFHHGLVKKPITRHTFDIKQGSIYSLFWKEVGFGKVDVVALSTNKQNETNTYVTHLII